MDGFLVEYADRLTDQFLNPKKRVFIGYLSCALVLAMGVQLIGSKSTLRRAAADIFSKNIWWSRSARTD